MVRDVAREFPIEEVLATSAWATVYRSTDVRTKMAVAVKIMNTAGSAVKQTQRQRYLRTMEAVKSIQLKGLPRIIAFGFSSDEKAFLVTAFVDGKRLSRCKGSPADRLLGLLGKVVETLEMATRCDVFHHNLNPENILVLEGADKEEIRLTGLGTGSFFHGAVGGKSLNLADGLEHFVASEMTPGSPEDGVQDWRADLFSLALSVVDVLGGVANDVGGADPSVTLPEDVRQQLANADNLVHTLQMALRSDPEERRIGWAEFRRALSPRNHEERALEQSVSRDLGATVLMPLDQLRMGGSADLEATPSATTEAYDVRQPPTAIDDSFETDEGSILKVPVPGILGNDSDPNGDPLFALKVSGPKHGILALEKDGSFSYAPDSGFNGADSFSYKANNGFQDSNIATVVITVNKVAKPPRVFDGTFSLTEGQTLEIPAPGVLENAIDPDGLTLKAIVVVQPLNGTLALASDGSFFYRPSPGFSGADSFDFRASNGLMASATATATITVQKLEHRVDKSATEASKTKAIETPPIPLAEADVGTARRRNHEAIKPMIPPPLPPLARIEPAPSVPPRRSTESIPKPPPIPKLQPIVVPEEEVLVEAPGDLGRPPPVPIRSIGFLQLLQAGPWAYVIGGIALVVIVVVALVAIWPDPTAEIQPEIAPTMPTPTRAPTPTRVPTEPPEPVIHSRLEAAERALLAGDSGLARTELEALTEEAVDGFSEEESGLYDHLLSAIEGGRREQSIEDLRGGLTYSSMKMIRRAMAGLSGMSQQEIAAFPGLARDIQRGRDAVQQYTLMERARREGDQILLLEHATSMVAMLPEFSLAHRWREEAAEALEFDAEALAVSGQYTRAITHLEPLTRLWPGRQGLQERLVRYRRLHEGNVQRQTEESDYEAYLETALERGRRGDPEDGIQMLSQRDAPPSLEQRRRQAIDDLEARLTELDASTPTIEIAPNTEYTYAKNQTFKITCRITDDHRVEAAVVMLRSEAFPEYREIPLAGSAGNDYSLEVGPDIHYNGKVEVYFEARDVSGHVGRLGSSSEPLVFDRKGFFKRIIGD